METKRPQGDTSIEQWTDLKCGNLQKLRVIRAEESLVSVDGFP